MALRIEVQQGQNNPRPVNLTSASPVLIGKSNALERIAQQGTVYINELPDGRKVTVRAIKEGGQEGNVALPRQKKTPAGIYVSWGCWPHSKNFAANKLAGDYQAELQGNRETGVVRQGKQDATVPRVLGDTVWRKAGQDAAGPYIFRSSGCGTDTYTVEYEIAGARMNYLCETQLSVRKRIRCHYWETRLKQKSQSTFTALRPAVRTAVEFYRAFGIDLDFGQAGVTPERRLPPGAKTWDQLQGFQQQGLMPALQQRAPRELWIVAVPWLAETHAQGVGGYSLAAVSINGLRNWVTQEIDHLNADWQQWSATSGMKSPATWASGIGHDRDFCELLVQGEITKANTFGAAAALFVIHEIGHSFGLLPKDRDTPIGGKPRDNWVDVTNRAHCRWPHCLMTPEADWKTIEGVVPRILAVAASNDAPNYRGWVCQHCRDYLLACDLRDIRDYGS